MNKAFVCRSCGNKTRFDVFETRRSRIYKHFSLGGELESEEEEVITSEVEKIVCRWCGSETVEEVAFDPTAEAQS